MRAGQGGADSLHRRARALGCVPGSARVRWRLDTRADAVALTFDDGPDERGTPLMLDLLAASGVSATFFVLSDRARAAPRIVRRIIADGHALGLHGDVHERLDRVPRATLASRLGNARSTVEDVAGRPVTMHRPPFGRVSLALLRAACAVGMDVVLWSHDPRDWDRNADHGLAERVARSLVPSAVVLLHDGSEIQAATTAAALGDVGSALAAHGLDAVALSDHWARDA